MSEISARVNVIHNLTLKHRIEVDKAGVSKVILSVSFESSRFEHMGDILHALAENAPVDVLFTSNQGGLELK